MGFKTTRAVRVIFGAESTPEAEQECLSAADKEIGNFGSFTNGFHARECK
jgi:hypothetical protein